MILVSQKSGEKAVLGQSYTDFRGDTHVLKDMTPPHTAASTGRVYTDRGSFFPSVIGLQWVDPEAHMENRLRGYGDALKKSLDSCS